MCFSFKITLKAIIAQLDQQVLINVILLSRNNQHGR